jgi:hypothetical protein
MGKKSKVAAYQQINRGPKGAKGDESVRHLFGSNDWDPLDGYHGHRDQKYVKNVRPRSEGQQRLMEAIDKHLSCHQCRRRSLYARQGGADHPLPPRH